MRLSRFWIADQPNSRQQVKRPQDVSGPGTRRCARRPGYALSSLDNAPRTHHATDIRANCNARCQRLPPRKISLAASPRPSPALIIRSMSTVLPSNRWKAIRCALGSIPGNLPGSSASGPWTGPQTCRCRVRSLVQVVRPAHRQPVPGIPGAPGGGAAEVVPATHRAGQCRQPFLRHPRHHRTDDQVLPRSRYRRIGDRGRSSRRSPPLLDDDRQWRPHRETIHSSEFASCCWASRAFCCICALSDTA